MGRGVVTFALVLVGGCALTARRPDIDPHFTARLPDLRDGLGAPSGPGGVALRYDVHAWDGRWVDDVVVTQARFVERRRRDDGDEYTFGEDTDGAFLRVGADGPWRVADPTWRAEARTRHAFFATQFLAPAPGDDAELVGRYRSDWEFAYRAAGGKTMTFDVPFDSGMPDSYDTVDGFGRLFLCEDVVWKRVGAQSVPRSADCWSGNGTRAPQARHARYELVAAASLGAQLPLFARVPERRDAAAAPTGVQTYALASGGRSAHVPVLLGDGAAAQSFVVDTGAFWTTVDADVARDAGVVPTGEPPVYIEPPWLPSGEYQVGVVDHLRVAGADLVGVRVLMLPGLKRALAGADGLLGANVLSSLVVDFDTPHHELRFYPPGVFTPDRHAFRFALATHGDGCVMVPGAVDGLGRGQLMIDTGAELTMAVTAPGVAAVYPRHRGTDAGFGMADDAVSADYWTTIDGARLGPFALPAMLATARDRRVEAAGDQLAIVGMGVLRLFRVVFDFHAQELYVWPGDAYFALVRSGVEVATAADGGARVTSIALRSAGRDALLREGDRIVAIDDAPVADADAARAALAAHPGARVSLRVVRRGVELPITLALDPRLDACTGPGDPMCPADGLLLAEADAPQPVE